MPTRSEHVVCPLNVPLSPYYFNNVLVILYWSCEADLKTVNSFATDNTLVCNWGFTFVKHITMHIVPRKHLLQNYSKILKKCFIVTYVIKIFVSKRLLKQTESIYVTSQICIVLTLFSSCNIIVLQLWKELNLFILFTLKVNIHIWW